MITSEQLMDGAHKLWEQGKVRYQHSLTSPIPFDRFMYAEAANKLAGMSSQLRRLGECIAKYDAGQSYGLSPEGWQAYFADAKTLYDDFMAQITPIKQEESVE